LPTGLPQGTKLVMMPAEKPNVGISGVTGCEYWHSHSPHAVLVGFDVEPDGTVQNATVTESSGDPAIDKDAIECVSRRTYKPATRDGAPIEIRLAAQLYANQ
jgi:TonB family protein